MQPLSTYKPPLINEDTERVFKNVNDAFNDIERRLCPPAETLDERRGQLVEAYEAAGKLFEASAAACGVDDSLRYSVASRIFTTIVFDETNLDKARTLYEQMERLGHPSVDLLISLRMIWSNVLADANKIEEARTVAKQLLDDSEAFRQLYPDVLKEDFDYGIAAFRQRHGI